MWKIVGLMSGTSLDGVDAAVLLTDGERIAAQGARLTVPYEPELRAALRALLDRAPTLGTDDPDLRAAELALTDRHAEAVATVLGGGHADLVGFHGQTILHRPEVRRTWQIGDAARLAGAVRLPVACDFRLADVAAGGQGAPLAPLYHQGLAAGLARPLAVLNLGGVGNLSWLGADGTVIACDTGPGNALLDDFVAARTGQAFDRDGGLAARGRVDRAVLARLLDDPFFARPAPKSLDRLDFSARVAASGLDRLGDHDGAATLAAFTAGAVGAALRHLPAPPLRWLVTGGGRHNRSIMRALADLLAAQVDPVEAVGWDGDALEAQAFAFLAARVRRGLPLSLPTTTGVPLPMPGGRIAAP
ncbi:MAG: anhydro-N-acetylmuramic acid kinase [Acetobacteraceae bacterium]|nr:anhydro-N-acetylmuramic acid kinase [Acetobacteraceae bacterium]